LLVITWHVAILIALRPILFEEVIAALFLNVTGRRQITRNRQRRIMLLRNSDFLFFACLSPRTTTNPCRNMEITISTTLGTPEYRLKRLFAAARFLLGIQLEDDVCLTKPRRLAVTIEVTDRGNVCDVVGVITSQFWLGRYCIGTSVGT